MTGEYNVKRFLLGIVLGALIGFAVWAVVIAIGIWESWTIPVITGTGVGALIGIATWLAPNPKQVGRYLRAFWEVWKVSPEQRILYAHLARLHEEQREQPHQHIYLAEDEVDFSLSVNQSPNTVRVRFWLISCLLEDTPIETCEIVLVYGGYEAPQGFPLHQITNLLKLTSGNRHSYVVSVTDEKMKQFVYDARAGSIPNEFSLEVRLLIRGKMEKVQRLNV